MFKFWKGALSNSIVYKIFVLFTVIACCINISIGLITYYNTLDNLKEEQQESSLQLLDNTKGFLNSYVKYLQNMVIALSELDSLKNFEEDSREVLLKHLVNYGQAIAEYADAVHFISTDGAIVSTHSIRLQLLEDVTQLIPYKNALASKGRVSWSQPYKSAQNEILISCSMMVGGQNGKNAGVIIVDTNFDKINNFLYNLQYNQKESIFILDSNGLVMSSTSEGNENAVMSAFKPPYSISNKLYNELQKYKRGAIDYTSPTGDRALIYYTDLDKMGWKILSITDYDLFHQKLTTLQRNYVWLSAIFIVLTGLIGLVFAVYLSKPLRRLTKTMEKVEGGDLDVSITINRNDEIGRLANTFNRMIVRIQALISDTINAERAKRENDFRVLQAQINPHFLYNTLSSINCMVDMDKKNEIKSMITALINLLQASINKMDEIITIGKEIQNIRNYITIQELRYGDKFHVEYDIDDTLLNFKLPKLILQPIVENAIFHGIQPKDGDGTIKVSIYLEETKIVLSVEDDGIGMTEDKKNQILLNNSMPSNAIFGIGMKNVNDRIKLYYGDSYGVNIESAVGLGCKVDVSIPVIA